MILSLKFSGDVVGEVFFHCLNVVSLLTATANHWGLFSFSGPLKSSCHQVYGARVQLGLDITKCPVNLNCELMLIQQFSRSNNKIFPTYIFITMIWSDRSFQVRL